MISRSGPPESSSQTASRSIQPFLYESQMLCCTMHCQWGRNPQILPPFPWDFFTSQEQDRATATDNTYKNFIKIARVLREICSRTDRQTHTQTCSVQYFANAPAGEVILQRVKGFIIVHKNSRHSFLD